MTITQADREAAAAYWESQRIGNAATYRDIRDGKRDDSDLIQAFARHRADSTRELVAERDAYRTQAINRGWNWRMCDAYGREEYERQLGAEVDRTNDIMLGRCTLAESYKDPAPFTRAGQSEEKAG